VATVLTLGSFLFVMFRRDWVRRRGETLGEKDPSEPDDPRWPRWAS
jgi:hypothetical protein